ncbi:BamA/TamA family outer membrane protein [Nibrella saemangeumensis]|uniref:BamA/TamA family outer membrane protein n=1 Tax=Nibrella saemangeumensis TaxID=1084526 RepID=A0ABP8MZP4_9BACT
MNSDKVRVAHDQRGLGHSFGRAPYLVIQTWALLGVLLLSISGCISSKQLTQKEYLLYNQTVRGNRVISSDELESLIPQKPNRRILRLPFTPALWFYELGARGYNREAALQELQAKTTEFEQKKQQYPEDSRERQRLEKRYAQEIKRLRRKAEEGNWVMRALGEPPVYFYERDAQANAAKLKTYLFSKGFFNAQTSYRLDTLLERRIRVIYLVSESTPYRLRRIAYEIDDPRVDSLVKKSAPNSLLKVGERYDEAKLGNERVRVEELLRNNGYYTFSRQYIQFEPDSSVNNSLDTSGRFVDMWVKILNPPGQSQHYTYHIGDMRFVITRDETQTPSTQTLDTVSRNGIRYLLDGKLYATRLLDTKIRLRPGQLYRQDDLRETQRQLFLLNQFKFANINITDTTNRMLRTEIVATPLDKYEMTVEGGVSVLYQGQGIPGPFGNLSLRVRNFLGGLETLETSFRYGFEAQAGFSTDQAYFAQELGLNTSLIFPQILFPGKYRFLFSNSNPRTQVSLGYNYTNRPEFIRTNLRSTLAYNWQPAPNRQFTFLAADINLLRASFKNDEFGRTFETFLREQAEQGSTILNSFINAFASNISLTYTYNTNVVGQNRKANFLRLSVESGGTTLNLLGNQRIEALSRTFNNLQFFKYLRVNADFRHYIPLRTHNTLAFRVNSGLVYGYGPNGTAPYEKLFFAGGSNSVRAWRPRRLGPGSAYPRTDASGQPLPIPTNDDYRFDYSFEQPGDILLEGSAELRGRLFHLGADINGAFFVDAGNVWRFRQNSRRPEDRFYLNNFLTEMAVGTGVGIRLDFSFFIIRFDGAVKVYDPARRFITTDGTYIDERFILPKFALDRPFSGPNPIVVNFGIGYPF